MGELYVEYEYWVAAMQLSFAMLGMGATLTVNDFADVLREPKAVSIGVLIQLLMVPLVALFAINVFGLIGGVAVGVALVAAIPGGTVSNIFTYFAKGNVPLSISITALTTLACLVTTPLVLALLIDAYLPSDFVMPTARIMSDIAYTLLLPLVLGMMLLRFVSAHAGWISKWSIRISLLGIALIVIGSISAGRLDLAAFGFNNIAAVIGFLILIALVSALIARLMRLGSSDRTAIEMEVVVRNVNLAVLIKASMFPASEVGGIGDTVLFAILLYGVLQMLSAAIIIFWRRRAAA